MTIKELADLGGISSETVRRHGKRLFPERFINGVKTVFTENEAVAVMGEIKTKNDIVPSTQNVPQNMEVMIAAMTAAMTAAMKPLIEEVKQIKSTPALPAPVKEDRFSLVAYCATHNITVNRSELAMHGKELRKMANARGLEITKIPDERWGSVNSYPIEILDEYFEV